MFTADFFNICWFIVTERQMNFCFSVISEWRASSWLMIQSQKREENWRIKLIKRGGVLPGVSFAVHRPTAETQEEEEESASGSESVLSSDWLNQLRSMTLCVWPLTSAVCTVEGQSSAGGFDNRVRPDTKCQISARFYRTTTTTTTICEDEFGVSALSQWDSWKKSQNFKAAKSSTTF